jgi:O-antigen ligase
MVRAGRLPRWRQGAPAMTPIRSIFAPVALGFFALLPVVATGGGLAAAPLLGLAGVLTIRPSLVRQSPPLAVWLVLAFAAWAALSSLWSPFHNHGQALRLWLTLLPGVLFATVIAADAKAQRWVRACALAAVVVLIGLLAIEALFNMPLNRPFNARMPNWEIERNPSRGVSILLALLWAAVAALIARGGALRIGAAALAVAVSGVLSTQFEDTANFVAFGIGLTAFGLGFWLPKLAPQLISAALALWLLIAPFSMPILTSNQRLVDALPFSWAVRVGIWRYVCSQITQHPIFGSGLDASRAVTDKINVRGDVMRAVQLHPHSASLHIWYETGGVGAVLAAAALVTGGWAISRAAAHNRPLAAAACATFAALGVIANISFGAWQEWWDATLLIGASVILALGAKTRVA